MSQRAFFLTLLASAQQAGGGGGGSPAIPDNSITYSIAGVAYSVTSADGTPVTYTPPGA